MFLFECVWIALWQINSIIMACHSVALKRQDNKDKSMYYHTTYSSPTEYMRLTAKFSIKTSSSSLPQKPLRSIARNPPSNAPTRNSREKQNMITGFCILANRLSFSDICKRVRIHFEFILLLMKILIMRYRSSHMIIGKATPHRYRYLHLETVAGGLRREAVCLAIWCRRG